MVGLRWSGRFSAVLLFGVGIGLAATGAWAQVESPPPPPPPAEDVPLLEGPTAGAGNPAANPPAADPPKAVESTEPELIPNAPLHDALRLSETKTDSKPERAPKSPPPPVAERPSSDPPDPNARWFGGYWSWDPARDDFIWVSGAWRVPPADSIWVEGRWRRDADGWYRVPGVWSRRQEKHAQESTPNPAPAPTAEPAPAAVTTAGNWRENGPPVDRPAESPGPAPGPNYFYVPGQYAPDGDQRTVWKDGFWAQVQPGWDWVPARWARQADGWHYREGYWTRDTGPAQGQVQTQAPPTSRRSAARPGQQPLPSGVIESEPIVSTPTDVPGELPEAGTQPEPGSNANSNAGQDVITEAEKGANPVQVVPPPVVIVGPRGRYYVPIDPPVVGYGYRTGMPYRMIRPPSPLYGPGGVVVPDAVPPFVQRLMNRVLP